MNVTELLQRVRDYAPEVGGDLTDELVVRILDKTILSLTRLMVQRNEGYFNTEILVHASDFVNTQQDVWDYRHPTWITNIVECRRATFTGGGLKTMFPAERGVLDFREDVLAVAEHTHRQGGWEWFNENTLRLRDTSQALDLVVRVAKKPAPLFKGVIATKHSILSKLYMPTTLALGVEELEQGRYLDTQVEITSSSGKALGQRRSVTADNPHAQSSGSTRLHELRLDRTLAEAPVVGDTIESIMEIDETHSELVVLKAAKALFQRRNNTKGLRSIRDDLAEQMGMFISTVTPRQVQEPGILRMGTTRALRSNNPDRAQAHDRRA